MVHIQSLILHTAYCTYSHQYELIHAHRQLHIVGTQYSFLFALLIDNKYFSQSGSILKKRRMWGLNTRIHYIHV